MEHIFDFMKSNAMQFVSSVPDHLRCTICRNVLIDSRFAPCGCKFCLNCITVFLLDGCKPCPSGKEECVDVILNLKMDITKDPLSDAQIWNLAVRCPHDNCDHQCRLKAMPDHVTMCSNRPVECEFNVVGCQGRFGGKISIENHFAKENVGHMRLLLGFLKKMENDMQQRFDSMAMHWEEVRYINERRDREWITEKNQLHTSMHEMKEEIDEMKTVGQHTANEIQRINRTNEELEKKIQCQNKTVEELEEKVAALNEMRDRVWQTEKDELLTSMREMKARMDEMKAVEQHSAKQIQRIIRTNDELEKKMHCQNKTMETTERELREMEKKLKEVGENVEKSLRKEMTDEFKRVNIKQRENIHLAQVEQHREVEAIEKKLWKGIEQVQETAQFREFIWRVDSMRDKRREASNGKNEEVYSEYFYSHRNGYRIRLRMDPNGFDSGKGTHLSLSFIICKGPFDDVLQWPMSRKIHLAIIKQGTGQEHVGDDFSYEMDKYTLLDYFKKPIDDENVALGIPEMISWDELQKTADLLNNDVLFIKFSFLT